MKIVDLIDACHVALASGIEDVEFLSADYGADYDREQRPNIFQGTNEDGRPINKLFIEV